MKTVQKVFLLGAAVLLFSWSCDPEPPDPRDSLAGASEGFGIVGGAETGWSTWKGVVAVYAEDVSGNYQCTGTLIHPEVVLTAGHCITNTPDGIDFSNNPEQLSVLIGADLFLDVSYLSGVSDIAVHPQWQGSLSPTAVDLALVRLDTWIDFLPSYCLRDTPAVNPGEAGIIVGYGRTATDDEPSAGTHRVGNTDVLAVVDPEIEHGSPAGSCQGDSGGPLFSEVGGRWEVTGVMSHGATDQCNPLSGNFAASTVVEWNWIATQAQSWTGEILADSCTATGADDIPDVGCGDIDDPCCENNICIVDDTTCVAGYPAPGDLTCIEECLPVYCTTLEGYTLGNCQAVHGADFHACLGDNDHPPQTSCSGGNPCQQGVCLSSGLGYHCYVTDCDAQGSCPDGKWCKSLLDAGGEIIGGGCFPLPPSSDADTDADVDADVDVDGDTDLGTDSYTDDSDPSPFDEAVTDSGNQNDSCGCRTVSGSEPGWLLLLAIERCPFLFL